MNHMNPNETPEDIIAEYRAYVTLMYTKDLPPPTPDYVAFLLNRIEEAVGRMVVAEARIRHRNGNAAAMREAVSNAVRWLSGMLQFCDRRCTGEEIRVPAYSAFGTIDRLRAALAAPARNCDVGTAEEQTMRLRANCDKYKPSCKGCKFLTDIQRENCWLKWSQMPYAPAEGGAE